MASDDDIFALLDSVYGTEAGSRENRIDTAVQTIESTHQRAFSAMRQFTETGKIVTAADTANASAAAMIEAAAAAMEARLAAQGKALPSGKAGALNAAATSAEVHPSHEEPTRIMVATAPVVIDREQTEIVSRPSKSSKVQTPSSVVSGSGAEFHSGLTKTHIVRPKKWFSK